MVAKRSTLALALCIGAAACQHDPTVQSRTSMGTSAASVHDAKLPPLAVDSRWAMRDAPAPRVAGAADNSPLLFYLSIPLGASDAARFSHSSFVVRSGNRFKSFAGPFEPLPARVSGGIVRVIEAENAVQEVSADAGRSAARTGTTGAAPAAPAHGEYADALWSQLYRADGTAPARYAPAGSSASTAAAEED